MATIAGTCCQLHPEVACTSVNAQLNNARLVVQSLKCKPFQDALLFGDCTIKTTLASQLTQYSWAMVTQPVCNALIWPMKILHTYQPSECTCRRLWGRLWAERSCTSAIWCCSSSSRCLCQQQWWGHLWWSFCSTACWSRSWGATEVQQLCWWVCICTLSVSVLAGLCGCIYWLCRFSWSQSNSWRLIPTQLVEQFVSQAHFCHSFSVRHRRQLWTVLCPQSQTAWYTSISRLCLLGDDQQESVCREQWSMAISLLVAWLFSWPFSLSTVF